jgi:hypothetical protein
LFDRGERIACVSLGYVEAVAALSRRLSEENLARVESRLKLDWENMTRLHITGEVIDGQRIWRVTTISFVEPTPCIWQQRSTSGGS